MTTLLYQDLGMTVFLAQPSLESQVGYLRFRFSNIRFKLFVLGLAMLHQKDSFFSFHSFFFFFTLNSRFLTVWFFYLADKTQVNPQISLINVPVLNYLLRSPNFHERRQTTSGRSSNFGLRTHLKNFSRRRQLY